MQSANVYKKYINDYTIVNKLRVKYKQTRGCFAKKHKNAKFER